MGAYTKKVKAGLKWFARGQYLNQKYCSQAIFPTKAQALKWERKKKKEIEAFKISGDIPLKTLLEARLDYLKLDKNKEYYEDNRRHARLILETWGNIKVSKITKSMVNELLMAELKRCKANGLTNHRANALLVNIRSFFNYGINKLDLGIINPCKGIDKFSVDHKIKFIPTREMIEAVKEICTPEQRALVQFCDETACRISEALAFQVKDVLDNQIILYTRKSRNSNLIPRVLPRPTLPPLPKKGKVFEWTRRPDFLELKIKKLNQPTWSYHSLRHHRTHQWALEGKTTIEIMALLGHSSINTTMIYLKSLAINRL